MSGDLILIDAPSVAPWIVAALAGFVGVHLLGCRLLRTARRAVGGTESGSAEVEVCLVSPILLVVILMTIQFCLIINAVLVTEHAAFYAGRSVAVWVGEANSQEGPNYLAASTAAGSQKLERAQRSAAIAIAPVSPDMFAFLDSHAIEDLLATTGLDQMAAGSDWEVPVKVLPGKLFTAQQLVEVRVVSPGVPGTVPEGAAIDLELTHDFCLGVALAGRMLGWVAGDFNLWSRSQFSLPIRARVRVMNHGAAEAG